MILSHFKTASTTISRHLDDWGVMAHYFPSVFEKVDTGMAYPVVNLARMVDFSSEMIERIKARPVKKQAFILAMGNAHFAGLQTKNFGEKELAYTYKFLPMTLTQIFLAKYAQKYGEFDHMSVDATACASSLHSLMHVLNLHENFGFERVFVLAVDDAISPNVIDFFKQSGALAQKTPSAFDSRHHGFYLGQGAVLAMFETENLLSVDTPIAYLHGAYSASESNASLMGQREDGEGFIRAIQGLQDTYGLFDYSVVKTHGSGTHSNNLAERNALKSCLNIGQWVATAYKPHIGHTLGASGLLETCLLFEDMQDFVVPPIANRTELDEVFLSNSRIARNNYVLSLAAGMGNVYTATTWERFDG